MLCAAVNVDTDVDVRVKEEIIFRVPIQHVEQVIVKQVLVSDKKCKHKGKWQESEKMGKNRNLPL
jgi:hypothetical protein